MAATPKILIVDDEKLIIKLTAGKLIANGYEVDSCMSGLEALQRVQECSYDLVLLDVIMPGMDGYETCKRLHELNRDLAVILVTGNTDDESLNKGFEAGALDYIKKPWLPLELLARVKNIINIKEAERTKDEMYQALVKDLHIASRTQEYLLPKWILPDEQVLFSSHYVPSQMVGGDLFDQIKISEKRYLVYIGDISGHGVQAALLMTAVKSIIRMTVEAEKDNLDLPELLMHLNLTLSRELFKTNYMTLLIGIINLESNEFQFISAGHPPLLEYDQVTHKTKIYDKKGTIPIGWRPKILVTEADVETIALPPNKIVLLYTDGIYECTNKDGEEFGIRGLIEVMEHKINVNSCVTLPYKIKQYLIENQYGSMNDPLVGPQFSDDFTLFAFQRQLPESDDAAYTIIDDRMIYRKLIFQVRAALKEVSGVAMRCENLVLQWLNDRQLAMKVELIIDEILNNIIIYGYNYDPDSLIVIEFSQNTSNLYIKIWDKGIEWIPDSLDYNADSPYDFDQDPFQENGRGMKMILNMTSRFSRHRFEEVNETSMEIRF